MTAPLTVYRRSELQAIADGCMHRYRAIWLDGADDSSDIALVGIGLHAATYRYILKLEAGRMISDSEAAREAFTEGVAAAQTPARLLPEMRETFDRWTEYFEFPLEQFVTAEERQSSGRVGWTPDMICADTHKNELVIHDFKFGWQPPLTEDELRVDFQARVYAAYGRDRWPGFTSYAFALHAARFRKIVKVSFDDEAMDQIQREVQAHIATIEEAKRRNVWPAVAGPSCRFCSLQCPLVDQAVTIPKRILDASQAQQFAGWLLAAETMVKTGKRALKAYCSGHGPVNVGGVVWDHRESEQVSYPVDVVLEALKALGLGSAFEDRDWHSLTLSRSALSKLFKSFPNLEAELAQWAQRKSSYRFSAKQAGEDDSDE